MRRPPILDPHRCVPPTNPRASGEFADANEELLKRLPPPLVAAEVNPTRHGCVVLFAAGRCSGRRACSEVFSNATHLSPLPHHVQYYRGVDVSLFDGFQTSQAYSEPRRPSCNNLHEVFINIRDDEGEHVATMHACLDFSVGEDLATLKGRAEEGATSSVWDAPAPTPTPSSIAERRAPAQGGVVAPNAPPQQR